MTRTEILAFFICGALLAGTAWLIYPHPASGLLAIIGYLWMGSAIILPTLDFIWERFAEKFID